MSKQTSPPRTPLTVTILRLSHDGRGIAQHQGKTIFVSGALPGEDVSIRLQRRHTHFDEARTLSVLSASQDRQTPRCPHFGACGGCSLQHYPQDKTLSHKLNSVLSILSRQAHIVPCEVKPTLVAAPFGYRRRARLAVHYDQTRQQLALGFREKNSHRITPLSRCEIMDPWFGERLASLTEQLNQLTHKEHLTELTLLADGNEKAIIVRHRRALIAADIEKLTAISASFSAKLIVLPESDTPTPLHYELPHHGLTLQYGAEQFIQVNAAINQQLVDAALDLLAPESHEQILDLFCGVGNFSLPIAQRAAQVVGVEGDASAIAYATSNAKNNQLNNTQFFLQNLFLPTYQGVWTQQRYAKLLIDPPRAGAKEVMGHLATWRPNVVVYVSCNPFTLARDAALLVAQGYRLFTLQLADMFPQTEHCEVIAQFTR